MENALLFTGLLVLAATAGGVIGSCCAKSRQSEDVAQKLQALRDRVEFLETKVQDADERLCLCERYDGESAQRIHELEERVAECELLIGDPPTEGLLGRVGDLEEARTKEHSKLVDLVACVDAQGETLEELREKHNGLGNDYETTRSHVKSLFAMNEALEDGFRENRDKADALAVEIETLKGRFDTFEGGASLELSGLRKSVEALEGKQNG